MADQLYLDFDPVAAEDDDGLGDRTAASAPNPRPAAPAPVARTMRPLPSAPPGLAAVRLERRAANLAEVNDAVAALPGLTPTQRRDRKSAVCTLARLLGLSPAQLPADPRELRHRLRDVHPAAVGMSRKRFRNVMTDSVRALRNAGIRVNGRYALVPFTLAWQALHEACLTKWYRFRLASFMHWNSEQGIVPDMVDTTTLDAFMADREATSLELDAVKLRRFIAANWNACVDQVPGWPQTKLDVVPARIPWTLKWPRFTPAFRQDVDACIERLAGVDLLDEDGPDKPLRPATLEWRRFQIRMAASSLVAAGVPVEAIASLEDVVRPEPFRRLIRNLLARYGGKTANIYGLATSLKSIAHHHCKLADDELDALRNICRRVLVKQRGLTQKNRDRLRPFTDPDTRDRLLLLPQKLMREALRSKEPDRQDAMTAQLAIALEIAQMAPLRAANLVSLEVGRNLIFIGKGRQEYAVITIPEAEVKNEVAIEYPLPPESTALIKRYITTFLPKLGQPGGRHLFPSPRGGAKRPTTLGNQIAAVVLEATGHRIHLHLLRHFAAMIYLQAYPGAYEAVRRILGHATASAALNAYVGLEAAAAARQFDEVVLRHRRLASLRAGQGRRRLRR